MAKSGANVRAISALSDLRGALGKFTGETQASLQLAEQEIKTTLSWLQERRAYWATEVRRCEADAEKAQRALANCQRQQRESRDKNSRSTPTCRDQEEQVRKALRMLESTQHELRNVAQWLERTQQAAAAYRTQANRLAFLATQQTPKAQVVLSRKVANLEAYTHLAAPAAAALAGIVASIAPALIGGYLAAIKHCLNSERSAAVREAKRQEIALVQRTGRGTRDWTPRQLVQLKKGRFPKGYQGHHINSVKRFPELARNPDNIRFLTFRQHLNAHWGNFRRATSGRMFNRKSLMVQWVK
ncbi:MAG: hypothetical protein JXA21_23030 [Anaerolineae bacterium]|nr:hypothetical protein [Anaerolineae bacterium]